MKSSVTNANDPKAFKPFTLVIEVETLEEALALRALYGSSGMVESAIMECASNVEALTKFSASTTYCTAFEPVHEALKQAGHI